MRATQLGHAPAAAASPVFASAPVTQAVVFAAYAYQATASDADATYGDSVTYSRVAGPAGLTVSSSGLVSWTPGSGTVGTHVVTVRAQDSRGATADQDYRILVTSTNHPPRFVSTPVTLAISGQTYGYDIAVSDPDSGDTPSLSLVSGPAGMTLSGSLLSWSPSSATLGTHAVVLRATDREAVSVTQAFALDVDETNYPPTLTSTAPRQATQDALYTYQVVVSDPNARDGATFTLPVSPAGMTIGAGGQIRWTPGPTQVGTQAVRVRVRDFGGLTRDQAWTVTVANVNDAPVFSSTPVNTATEDAAYAYTAAATDADSGDTVRYALEVAPSGMQIHATSGVVSWTPGTRQVGAHAVRIRASDTHGSSTTQSYSVAVTNTNDAPEWVSTPLTTVLGGSRYQYRPAATDPDSGDTVSYAVVSGPAGLTYAPTSGLVSWVAPMTGQFTIVLRASDAANASALQTFEVTVEADEVDPRVEASISPQTIAPGGAAVLSATWTDDSANVTAVATMDGTPLTLDANGQATLTSTVPGLHIVTVVVTDGAGNATTVESRLGVHDPTDTEPPRVALTAPVDDEIVLMRTAVTGTIAETNLVEWRLVLTSVDGLEQRVLGRGTDARSGNLGVVDGTLLENGWWSVTLEATDVNGVTSSDEVVIEVQGAAKVGVLRLVFTDMQIPVSGIPITITRSYDSRKKSRGDFGIGWDLDIQAGKIEHNRSPGVGWSIHQNFPPPSFPCTVVDELESHYTTVRLSDAEWYTFRPNLINVASSLGSCYADIEYEFVDGYVPGATLDILGNTTVVHLSGTDELVDELTFLPFEPTDLLLTTPDGRQVTLEAGVGIREIGDLLGNTLTFGPLGISHSSGKAVTFARDGEGRITRITDPMGEEVEYIYDAAGDLVSFENQLHERTLFEYSPQVPHHLTRVIGPDGLERMLCDYDEDSRLRETCNAEGQCTALGHDLGARRQTITDPSGRTTNVYYDVRGNITATVDGLSQATTFERDSAGNVTAKIDPLGRRTTFEWDASRHLLSTTAPHAAGANASDYTTTYTYDSLGNQTSVELPSGGVFYFDRNAAGHLTALRDANGTFLTLAYDATGNVTEEGDRYSLSTYTHDTFGNEITSSGPDGSFFEMTYDDAGKLATVTGDRGESWAFSYDALGRETLSDYGDGLAVSYGYGYGTNWTTVSAPTLGTIERNLTPLGRLAGWRLASGGEINFRYDAAGRLLEEEDPLGNITRFTYDDAGRLSSRTDSNGGVTTYVRDPLGRVVSETDAVEAVRTSSYAVDGSIAFVRDARGHTTSFSRTTTIAEATDALGRITRVEKTQFGLEQRWVNADGTTRIAAHVGMSKLEEAESHPVLLIDEAGRSRSLTYDELGRLESATDTAEATYSYGYGRDGLTEITNPIGDTLTIELDRFGRTVGATYPDGTRREVVYGTNGKPSETRFQSGATISYAYDTANRVTLQQASGEPATTFAINANGGLVELADRIGTTTFGYDDATSLAEITLPGGAEVRYEHDLVGRLTLVGVRATTGGDESITEYSYDLAGNLTSVVDPASGTTTMTYDVVNRLVTRTLPNGVTTTWTYDLMSRIASVTHRRANSSMLASYSYERGPTGEPVRVEREDGSDVLLDYDDALRLTSEQHRNSAGAVQETISYAYDSAGNRLARASQRGVESYSYDPGSKLLAVSSTSAVETYGHDADGRLVSIVRDGVSRTLAYSAEGPLVSVTGGSAGMVTYASNGLGHRSTSTSSTGARRFVVAPMTPEGLPQTHAVVDGANVVARRYVHAGGRPLMRIDGSVPAYYLEDGLGSVIGVANSAGNLAGRAEYDGFGNIRSASGVLAGTGAVGGDYRFHGAWLEGATGLYHVHAREYDPRTGRFLSRDPAEPNVLMPETMHPYAFAASNPMLYWDLDGREFSLISLNMSMSISDVLRGVQQLAMNQLKEYAVDKAHGVATNIIASLFESMMPGAGQVLELVEREFDRVDEGNLFDDLVKDAVCGMFRGGGWDKQVHLAPSILASNGAPTGNGLECGESGSGDYGLGARPDFMISRWKPVTLGRGGHKSYLTGEIKLSLNGVVRAIEHNTSQMRAMVEHAQHYQHTPMLLFIAMNGGGGRRGLADKKFIGERMAGQGVMPVVMTVR